MRAWEHVSLYLKGCLLCKLCNVSPTIVDIDSSLVVVSIVCIGCSYRNVWEYRMEKGGRKGGGGHIWEIKYTAKHLPIHILDTYLYQVHILY